ncbi:MAG: methyltransferase domain-containing protein [Planctomycetaceae bacterium]|nr:methyltransferase domain-containing protein [Planctomycetaceae bacterium]
MTQRELKREDLAYDALFDDFQTALNDYDTQRRVEVLIDDFLGNEDLQGKTALDVGCGLGFFSQKLNERGANVTPCDIAPKCVQHVQSLIDSEGLEADVMVLGETLAGKTFDVVVSSECVEHTPDPLLAVKEICKAVKPGGMLALSTPNRVWQPVVRGAQILKLRRFDGYENFVTWNQLCSAIEQSGLKVLRREGLHLFPFQLGMHTLSRWLDRNAQWTAGVMINLCVLAKREL